MRREEQLGVPVTPEQANAAAYLRGSVAPKCPYFSIIQFCVYLNHVTIMD